MNPKQGLGFNVNPKSKSLTFILGLRYRVLGFRNLNLRCYGFEVKPNPIYGYKVRLNHIFYLG
jgi:hypothetical protein